MGWLSGLILVSAFLGIEYTLGVVLRPLDFLLFGTIFLALSTAPAQRLPYARLSTPVAIYLILLAYMAASAFFQSPTSTAVKEVIQAIETALLFIVLRIGRVTAERREQFDRIVVYGFLIIGTFTFLYHVSRGDYVGYKTLDEPKLVFGMLALYAFIRLWERTTLRSAFIFLCGMSLLFLSGERKGWAGACAALIVFLLFRRYSRSDSKIFATMSVILAGAIFVVIASSSSGYVAEQVSSIPRFFSGLLNPESSSTELETVSNRFRAIATRVTIDIISENPIFGVGSENLPGAMRKRQLMPVGKGSEFFGGAVHNEYLRFAAEGGIIAIALYLMAWIALIVQSLRNAFLLNRAGSELPPDVRIRGWFSIGLVYYGLAINFFLAGGLMNSIFFIWPCALMCEFSAQLSLPKRQTDAILMDRGLRS